MRIEHEARVSKIAEEQIFYLQSRGLTEDEARMLIVNGFFEPFVKELPMEYAVEMNRLTHLADVTESKQDPITHLTFYECVGMVTEVGIRESVKGVVVRLVQVQVRRLTAEKVLIPAVVRIVV